MCACVCVVWLPDNALRLWRPLDVPQLHQRYSLHHGASAWNGFAPFALQAFVRLRTEIDSSCMVHVHVTLIPFAWWVATTACAYAIHTHRQDWSIRIFLTGRSPIVLGAAIKYVIIHTSCVRSFHRTPRLRGAVCVCMHVHALSVVVGCVLL